MRGEEKKKKKNRENWIQVHQSFNKQKRRSEAHGLGLNGGDVLLVGLLDSLKDVVPDFLPLIDGPDLDLASVLELDDHVTPRTKAPPDRNDVGNLLHGAVELLLVPVRDGGRVGNRDAPVGDLVVDPSEPPHSRNGERL